MILDAFASSRNAETQSLRDLGKVKEVCAEQLKSESPQ